MAADWHSRRSTNADHRHVVPGHTGCENLPNVLFLLAVAATDLGHSAWSDQGMFLEATEPADPKNRDFAVRRDSKWDVQK